VLAAHAASGNLDLKEELALLSCSAVENPTAFGDYDWLLTDEADHEFVFSNATGVSFAVVIDSKEVKERPDRALRYGSLACHLGCFRAIAVVSVRPAFRKAALFR